jgi:hypothetical protein
MKTKTIQQTITFKARPMKVYEMLMDSKKHQSLSGEKAVISRRVRGLFTAWGSHTSGINLVLKPAEKIVQAWRATGWWPDHYSIAVFRSAEGRVKNQAEIHTERRASESLQWPLPRMDRDVLDADERDLREWPSATRRRSE